MIEFEFNAADRLLTITGHGKIDIDEIIALISEIKDDPSITAPFCTISDYSQASIGFESAAVRKIAQTVISLPQAKRSLAEAIVVNSDLDFGIARMYQSLKNVDNQTQGFPRPKSCPRMAQGLQRRRFHHTATRLIFCGKL